MWHKYVPSLKLNILNKGKICVNLIHTKVYCRSEHTKKMVSQTARRRINTISGHFGAALLAEDIISTSTNLFPSNCSSNLSTQLGQFRRLDNRLQYGRQATASQGFFMRQADNSVNSDVTCKSDINEKKSASDSATPPLFSRLGYGDPQFAKPRAELNCFSKMSPASHCPNFEETSERKLSTQRPFVLSQINGEEWSPRINVAESKCSYIIAVELPGVDIRDIRVEMDDKNLIVSGKRSTKWWKGTGCSNDLGVTYHKREISQGQYQVVWPLPTNANKNSISAEFMEGILEIAISKL